MHLLYARYYSVYQEYSNEKMDKIKNANLYDSGRKII